MTTTLHVRNLEPDLISRLKRRAARHGRSGGGGGGGGLRQALDGESDPTFDDLAAEMRRLTHSRPQTPSEILLRQARDER